MSDAVNAQTSKQLRLSDIIEFCGWLSIVTLVSGYIWIKIVMWGEGITSVQYFTISDYIAYGSSPAILFTAAQFLANSYSMNPQDAKANTKSLKITAICLFIFSILLTSLLVFSQYHSGHSLLSTPFLLRIVGSFVFVNAVPAGVFIAIYAPIRLNFLSLALIIAGVIWISTAFSAARFSIENTISADDIKNPTKYQFVNSTYSSDKWMLFMSTDRHYYFVRPENGQIEIQKSSDIEKIIVNSQKTPFGFASFIGFIRNLPSYLLSDS